MDRGSDKHSPRVDEQFKHETRGLVSAGHQTHAEEWKQSEPSGEDEPAVDLAPEEDLTGGTPPGMTAVDVARRSELAVHLGKEVYPAVREQLLDTVLDRHAPEHVVAEVRRLPSGRQFHNVNEVWEALGGHTEQQRF